MFTRNSMAASAVGSLPVFLLCALIGYAQIVITPENSSHSGLGGANVIIGTVFAPSGVPIQTRIRVRLSATRGSDRITVTDESGNYAFRGLPTGGYSLSIDREPEYKPTSNSVDIMQFRGAPPNTYTVNFQLEFVIDKGFAKPAVVNALFAGVPPKAVEYYNIALDHSKIGQHEAAVGYLELAIKEHADFMLAYNEIGVQFLKIKKHAEAEVALHRAMEIDSTAFAPTMNMGIVMYQTGRFSEAETHLRKALDTRPDDPSCHYLLGRALASLDRFDEAEKFLVRALSAKNPQMAPAHRVLGEIYLNRGASRSARIHFEAYLKAFPDALDAKEVRQKLDQLR